MLDTNNAWITRGTVTGRGIWSLINPIGFLFDPIVANVTLTKVSQPSWSFYLLTLKWIGLVRKLVCFCTHLLLPSYFFYAERFRHRVSSCDLLSVPWSVPCSMAMVNILRQRTGEQLTTHGAVAAFVVAIVFTLTSTLSVVFRLMAVRIKRRKLGSEDYTILAAQVPFCGIDTVSRSYVLTFGRGLSTQWPFVCY